MDISSGDIRLQQPRNMVVESTQGCNMAGCPTNHGCDFDLGIGTLYLFVCVYACVYMCVYVCTCSL